MQLFDTHCHIHEPDYPKAALGLSQAQEADVVGCVCIGTDLKTSCQAVSFAEQNSAFNVYAAVGIHPHEAGQNLSLAEQTYSSLADLAKSPRVVAIGEFGFDFFYNSREEALNEQLSLAERHFQLAQELDLPIVLHLREGFEEFFDLIKKYPNITGVIHSFSADRKTLKRLLNLSNNFYIGLNGIMTFSKDAEQLAAAREVPLNRLVLETDAPFLTPPPHRGKINSIRNVRLVAEFLAELRGESLADLAKITTQNAQKLFRINL